MTEVDAVLMAQAAGDDEFFGLTGKVSLGEALARAGHSKKTMSALTDKRTSVSKRRRLWRTDVDEMTTPRGQANRWPKTWAYRRSVPTAGVEAGGRCLSRWVELVGADRPALAQASARA